MNSNTHYNTSTNKGTVTGMVFTSTTLPITNYRYRKSMGMEIDVKDLYQAYLPTVLRDIVYGIVRNQVTTVSLLDNMISFYRNLFVKLISMKCCLLGNCIVGFNVSDQNLKVQNYCEIVFYITGFD